MPNINAFEEVVHEKKIFKYLSKFPNFWPLKWPLGGQPLDFNKSESPFPRDASHQIWLKLTKWFWRRSRLKEKVDGRTTDDAPTHQLSWPSAR